MLNLSIMQLDVDNIDQICEDIIEQQRTGVSSHALFMMQFAPPEGTPPINKAEIQCQKYEMFRERLDKANAKYGVLVQSTMGHLPLPTNPHPFQNVISLVDGSERASTCCPLDEGFRAYIKEQMRILATHKPSIVMIDDDVGLLYRKQKGCACPLHMAEFNRRAGTNMTREELYAHTQGKTEEDRRYTQIYVELIADSLEGAVKAMREGIDEVDPAIQGASSGIHGGRFCEFSDRTSRAIAGKNNNPIVRINNGVYTVGGGRDFTVGMYRAAIIKEYLKGTDTTLIAEADTCPHNRYATSATLIHAQLTGSILEGAKGAKLWITRLKANEPNAGKAYRKKLAQYHNFYEKLCEYADELTPFGCRIPLPTVQDYGFVPAESGLNLLPWATCVLERFGVPMYFSNETGGAVFLDDVSVSKFSDEQVKEYFKGTLVLSAIAAQKLIARGFGAYIGVDVSEWQGKPVHYDKINGHYINKQVNFKRLTPCAEGVEALSQCVHIPPLQDEEELFPSATGYENELGGYTVVFCGTPDTPFHYTTAFSFLNESRKNQFIKILERQNNLPIYYAEDAEVYVRAGYLKNGEMLCALFNLGLDVLDEITLVSKQKVNKIEKLNADGTRSACEFYEEDGVIHIREEAGVLCPVILFLS